MVPPQPAVNNFGGEAKMGCEQRLVLLGPKPEHAGSGRRIQRLNARRFVQDFRSGTLRPVVKERSEPIACKLKVRSDEHPISPSTRQGQRAH